MTRYADNIYSGFQAPTSGASSKSPVVLRKTHNFTNPGGTASVTQTGTFPPNTQNLRAELFIMNQGASATASDKVTVSAGGVNLYAITGFGSAVGIGVATQAGFATFTVTVSAVATVVPPATNQNNGGEIPYSVTWVPSSAGRLAQYQLALTFNRADTNTLGTSQ